MYHLFHLELFACLGMHFKINGQITWAQCVTLSAGPAWAGPHRATCWLDVGSPCPDCPTENPQGAHCGLGVGCPCPHCPLQNPHGAHAALFAGLFLPFAKPLSPPLSPISLYFPPSISLSFLLSLFTSSPFHLPTLHLSFA